MSDAGFKAVLADKNNKHLLIALLNFLLPEGVVVSDIVSYEDRERSKGFRRTVSSRGVSIMRARCSTLS